MAHYTAWRANLRTSHYELLENLELAPVLDYCLSKGDLSQRITTEISEVPTSRERVRRFLDAIQDGSDLCLRVFVDGLIKSKQEHLSHLLTGVGDAVIMRDDNKRKLKEKRIDLVQNLEPFMVINCLRGQDVLTPQDAERMTSLEAKADQSSALLDAIIKKPDHAFGHLVEALNKTKQGHLATLLEQTECVQRDEEKIALREENAKLKEEILKLRTEMEAFTKRLADNQSEAEIHTKYRQLNEEFIKVSSTLKVGEAQIIELKKELPQLESRYSEQVTANTTANQTLKEREEQITDLKKELSQQESRYTEQVTANTTAKQQISYLENEMEQRKSMVKRLESTNVKLNKDLQQAEGQVKECQVEHDRTKKAFQEKEHYIKKLENDFHKLGKENETPQVTTKAKLSNTTTQQNVKTEIDEGDEVGQVQGKMQSLQAVAKPEDRQTMPAVIDPATARLVLDQDVSAICPQIRNPVCVAPLHDGGLLVAYGNILERVDEQGHQQGATFTCPSIYIISALCVLHDSVLVMQCDGTISRCLLTDLSTAVRTYKVDVSNPRLEGGDVIDSHNIVFTDWSEGCIYTYNLTTERQEKVVSRLQHPRSVVHAQTSQGPVFVLTERGTHQVHVYDQAWRRRYSMGGRGSRDGQLDNPRHAAVTEDRKYILVADYDKQRISLFSLQGQFIRHVLTQNDGLGYPINLACRNDHVWVIYRQNARNLEDCKVKRFKYVN